MAKRKPRSLDAVCDDMIQRAEAEPCEALIQRYARKGLHMSREQYVAYRSRHWSGMWPDEEAWPPFDFFAQRAELEWRSMFGEGQSSRNARPTLSALVICDSCTRPTDMATRKPKGPAKAGPSREKPTGDPYG